MLRAILGLVAGFVAAGVAVFAAEMAGHALWPPPAGMDPMDPESIRANVHLVPLQAKIAVVTGWGLAALIGGVVAKLIARTNWSVWVIAALLLAAALYNLTYIPSPIWMWVAGIAIIPIGACAATKLVRLPAA
jgi:hypothetical protein